MHKLLFPFLIFTLLAHPFFAYAKIPAKKELNDLPPFLTKPTGRSIVNMLMWEDNKINLAFIKATMDKYSDRQSNPEYISKRIEQITEEIKQVPGYKNTKPDKLRSLLTYVYKPGSWNNNKYYQYNFDDPLGTSKGSSSLQKYLLTKKGNCVSMPFLLLLVGRNLGLDVTLVDAPKHTFLRYSDGKVAFNIEATHGQEKRDSSYIKELAITKKAVESGIYMKSMTNREIASRIISDTAVILAKPINGRVRRIESELAFKLANLALKFNPDNFQAMLTIGNYYYLEMTTEMHLSGLKQKDYTPDMHKRFKYLVGESDKWYDKAYALGWTMPDKNEDKRYIEMINRLRPQIDQY